MVVFLYWIWSNCLGQFFHRSEPVTILTLLIVQAAEELLQGAAALTDRDAQRHLPLGTALGPEMFCQHMFDVFPSLHLPVQRASGLAGPCTP